MSLGRLMRWGVGSSGDFLGPSLIVQNFIMMPILTVLAQVDGAAPQLESKWLVVAAITAIGSSVLIPLMNLWVKNREKNTELVIDNLKEQVASLKKEVDEARQEKRQLEIRIAHLEAAQEDYPFPVWSTDRKGSFAWVNHAFWETFLAGPGIIENDIIGRDYSAVWEAEVAEKLKMFDRTATQTPRHQAFVAGFKFDGVDSTSYTLYRFPTYRGSQQTGWVGIALPERP